MNIFIGPWQTTQPPNLSAAIDKQASPVVFPNFVIFFVSSLFWQPLFFLLCFFMDEFTGHAPADAIDELMMDTDQDRNNHGSWLNPRTFFPIVVLVAIIYMFYKVRFDPPLKGQYYQHMCFPETQAL